MHNHNQDEKVEIKISTINGKGTFAKKKINKGEYIFTLAGELIVVSDVRAICIQRGISGDDPLQIDDDKFLILNYASKTINHCCSPNGCIKKLSDLYAMHDIQENEEITYDYSTTSPPNDTWTMMCNCQSKNCRKLVGNVMTIPSKKLFLYLKQDNLPYYIKKQLKSKLMPIL